MQRTEGLVLAGLGEKNFTAEMQNFPQEGKIPRR